MLEALLEPAFALLLILIKWSFRCAKGASLGMRLGLGSDEDSEHVCIVYSQPSASFQRLTIPKTEGSNLTCS